MKLRAIVNDYIDLKQSMGMRFASDAVILRAFCKAAGDLDIEKVEPDTVSAYLWGNSGTLTSFWHRKHDTLKGFYRYATGRGYASSSPVPAVIPKRPRTFSPYIYSAEEFDRLLRRAVLLESRRYQVDSVTFRTLLCLLFNTGVRIGEAISLAICDVSFAADLLTIRSSKFYKTRFVPIHPRLCQLLRSYALQRSDHPGLSSEGPLFVKRDGSPLNHGSVERAFRYLCECCGIRRTDGARYQPRLHDIRHAFCVNRLLEWYRQGADVQRLLPHLSTYLGHRNIGATQQYLTMTPELLGHANKRFEQYALAEVTHG
jgi:integrase